MSGPGSAPLRIRDVRVRPLDLGLARPVETAAGVMRTAPLVEWDEELVGRLLAG